jgi:hypothetical protein
MNDFAQPRDIGAGGKVNYGTDDGLIVEFYIKPVLMEADSKSKAHPVYQDRLFTRIVSPGNTKTTWDHMTKGVVYTYGDDGALTGCEVEEMEGQTAEPNKYPKAWERFQKKGQKVKEGWDITTWGAIPRSLAETLKSLNVHTVEALANMSDANVTNIMGGLKFRNLAKAALSDAATLELAAVEQERADKANEENKALKRQISAMQEQIDALKAKKDKAA